MDEKLITAGKKPLQAITAVMRKLLHAIWGVWNYDQDFDGQGNLGLAGSLAVARGMAQGILEEFFR